MASTKAGPNSRPAYRALRDLKPTDEPCRVPACTGSRLTEDCCYDHSLNKSIAGALENDGVLDWLAIDIAAEGTRLPGLTWVEWEIAAATILANGHPESEIEHRLGSPLRKSPSRRERIRAMAAAIEVSRGN